MSDSVLVHRNGAFDLSFNGADLDIDNGLLTSVLVSLFTDARLPDYIQEESAGDRRGVWTDSEEVKLGSLLWTLARSKTTEQVAARFKQYCLNALQWLVDDGICAAVDVEPLLVPPYALQVKITLFRGEASEYSYLWKDFEKGYTRKISDSMFSIQFI